ncbi:hypothetical protein ID866_4992 [Astraeus odoratus]|nr:hypothetical protein ID866_4992 [Astraeus odoratus]
MPVPPRVRVVVQLPYDRPEHPLPDPPRIEWNAEKANILWEVIALSRTSDNGGTDWKGLAAHLEVPLPYLLYRAQARYEEDLRGLKDIPGILAPVTLAQHTVGGAPPSSRRPSSSAGVPPQRGASPSAAPMPGFADRVPPPAIRIPLKGASGGALSTRALSASAKLATPLGVRVRLNSLTHKSPSKSRLQQTPEQAQGQGEQAHHSQIGHARVSSSTATLQGVPLRRPVALLRPSSPFSEGESSDSSDASEVMRRKEEEEERNTEERETLDKKLAQLQKTMTTEMVGLVRNPTSPGKGKEREGTRGRTPFPIPVVTAATAGLSGVTATGSPAKLGYGEDVGIGLRHEEVGFAPRNRDHSASVSSASSPQGSVPSIPSPTSPSSPRSVPGASSQTPPHSTIHGQTIMRVAGGHTPIHIHTFSQPISLSTSPMARHISPPKSSSPPAVSARNVRGLSHLRPQGQGRGYGAPGVSEGESTHGSSASSFSDLSAFTPVDASFSASALESALMSNIRAGGSRLWVFLSLPCPAIFIVFRSTATRSRLGGRGVRQ